MTVHLKVETISKTFSEKLKQAFGNELVSVILYGSATTDDYNPQKSDHNFLVVLTPKGIQDIKKIQSSVRSWKRNRILFPLFMTREYIHSSLDSFPIEFFNIKQAYQVIFGEDVLANMEIKKKDIRIQCERELKGKLLHLRQDYILTQGKSGLIRRLIGQSIMTFASIFRALLFMKNIPIQQNLEAIIKETCGEFHLDLALFQNLLAIRQKGITYTKFELEHFMQRYILEIDRLCKDVDQFKTN